MTLHLTIVNKAYSSWSLRPWLLMRQFGIAFEETVIPMRQSDTSAGLLAVSPTGKVPVLRHGDVHVWESLAIIEYLADCFPHLPIWPRESVVRAFARSISCEMHAGFMALRQECPTNFRRQPRAPRSALSEDARANIARIEAIFAESRSRFGAEGPFLMGQFGAADAMFAPVINRFYAYDIKVSAATKAYMDSVRALPAWQQWHADGAAEPWVIEAYEVM